MTAHTYTIPDGANDVYSSLQIYRYLNDMAPPGVDPTTLASNNVSTASSWQPLKVALGKVPPARPSPISISDSDDSDDVTTASPKGTVGAGWKERGLPSPRQKEAYQVWHVERMDPDAAADKMSATRPIKPLSVVYVLLPLPLNL